MSLAADEARRLVESVTTVEEDLAQLDRVSDTSLDLRTQMVNKLTPYIEAFPDPKEFPDKMSAASAQMMPIQMLASLLKEQDKSTKDRVATKMKDRDGKTLAATAGAVADFMLKPVAERMKGMEVDLVAYGDKALDEIEQSDNPVTDDELKDDPYKFG
jgi:hypothetical protein